VKNPLGEKPSQIFALKKRAEMLSFIKFGPGEGLRPRRLSISEGRRGRTHWVSVNKQSV